MSIGIEEVKELTGKRSKRMQKLGWWWREEVQVFLG